MIYFIVRKRRDGGLVCSHYGEDFPAWDSLQRDKPDHLPGFVAVGLRPPVGSFDVPISQWDLVLHYQPCEVPGWVRIGEVRAACIQAVD